MCGICGIYNLDGAPAGAELMRAMRDTLAHRGPDGEGEFVAGEIALGHRRLSIIDLEGGAQPVANEDGTLQTVFNGEIYNYVELREELQGFGHRFKTRSDTEVIVHAYEQWGADCVSRFNGIFAFAVWDSTSRRLFLARDHLGVKPLYYIQLKQRLLFASEIKALLADPECPREVDLRSLGQLFALRYVPSPATLFRGIRKIPPGHHMMVTSGGVRTTRFWAWTPQISARPDEAEAVETYRCLLKDAVRLQMRSDVPVGLFLSSGIDSGALLALMNECGNAPIYTFTIGFEGGGATNETADARATAQRFGANHSEMIVGPGDYQNYYERYLWDLEEPVGNETAAAFYFVSLLARRRVKVALAGQGADEPWAGYWRHSGAQMSAWYSRLPSFFTDGIVTPLVTILPRSERLKRGASALSERDTLTRFVKIYSFYSSVMKRQLFQPWLMRELPPGDADARQALSALYADVEGLDPLSQEVLYMDTRTNLPDDLLMVGDKMSMANSLEARVPFLDYRLVQFIETLPPSLKLHGTERKYLHKRAIEAWLPKRDVYRKKKGFANPIHNWLRGGLRKYVGDCLMTESSAVRQYFNADYITQMLHDHETQRESYLRHIYLLISFELWHQRFISRPVSV